MSTQFLSIESLTKSYQQSFRHLEVLKGVSLEISEGEDVCIVGSSGAGKSTLLQIMGTLDRPTSGDVLCRGKSLFAMSDDQLAKFRGQNMGFVFQFHHLLGEFTALENIMMPCCIAGVSHEKARRKAQDLLKKFGLEDRAEHFPSEMSGGEQQRVAIARAIINEPSLLLADEPTGNLDSKNSQAIQDLFFELKKQMGITLVVVTHDRSYASKFGRCLEMADGLLSHQASIEESL